MAGLEPVSVEGYRFDRPAVVVEGRLHCFVDAKTWRSGSAWLDALDQLSETPSAFVLPLELSANGRSRQSLLGHELLEYLRFSASEKISGLPALLAAWQPLDLILSKEPDLLIIWPAVEFHRLPDACERLVTFITEATARTLPTTSRAEIDRCALGSEGKAARVTYHDLANDFYAARRIWIGYKRLLASTGGQEAQQRLREIQTLKFDWEDELETKLRRPLVRRFLAQRAHQPAPRYPKVENRPLVVAHASGGLPRGTRVLLVDDEFDKGVAEVLLRVLFHQSQFTARFADEWVYSEAPEGGRAPWARFVCVRGAALASNWLAYLERIDRRDLWGDDLPDSAPFERWRKDRGAHQDNPPDAPPDAAAQRTRRKLQMSDVDRSKPKDDALDQPEDLRSSGPHPKSTVVLLDLRLQKLVGEHYPAVDLDSYKFRTHLKAERPDIPVIMFTASRQVLNLAEILDSLSDIDGWFVKEGPDIPAGDDSNSANAVAALLERLHLVSVIREWYRPVFRWDTDEKFAFNSLFDSPQRDSVLAEVSTLSTTLFTRIRDTNVAVPSGQRFVGWVNENVTNEPFLRLKRTLVARRLALVALYWTCDSNGHDIAWNAEQFARFLPGDTADKTIKYVSDKVNFQRDLWMRTHKAGLILSHAFANELEWLAAITWPGKTESAISDAITREINSRV